jgi:hypothetical protein
VTIAGSDVPLKPKPGVSHNHFINSATNLDNFKQVRAPL